MMETYACRECVDANTVLAPFLSDGAAHLVDGGFGRVVGCACEALESRISLSCILEDKDLVEETYPVRNLSRHGRNHDNASRRSLLLENARAMLCWDECADDAIQAISQLLLSNNICAPKYG
jgi:hypothetical protein